MMYEAENSLADITERLTFNIPLEPEDAIKQLNEAGIESEIGVSERVHSLHRCLRILNIFGIKALFRKEPIKVPIDNTDNEILELPGTSQIVVTDVEEKLFRFEIDLKTKKVYYPKKWIPEYPREVTEAILKQFPDSQCNRRIRENLGPSGQEEVLEEALNFAMRLNDAVVSGTAKRGNIRSTEILKQIGEMRQALAEKILPIVQVRIDAQTRWEDDERVGISLPSASPDIN